MSSAMFAVIAVIVIIAIIITALIMHRAARKSARTVKNAVVVFDPGMKSNTGKVSGTVTFHQESPGAPTLVKIALGGLPPGTAHGIHVHRCGDLTSGCESACQHFDPDGRRHGSQQLHGSDRHAGDLCNNITADAGGNASITYSDPLIALSGAHSIVGRSVVVHADPDDLGRFRDVATKQGEESAKTGNAGKRIACSVIGISDRDFSGF